MLNEINLETQEGKMLFGALAILTTTVYTDKTPDEVLKICKDKGEEMTK